MLDYKKEFLEFAISQKALKFGSFQLKSGRISPYFFDAGMLCKSGTKLQTLGRLYAAALQNSTLEYDMLYGPAYKGIPLVVTTSVALSENGVDVPIVFNRQEEKDHGEKGKLIGTMPFGKIVIIDDVITAGTAIRQSIKLIENGKIVGVIVALDREEVGLKDISAIDELKQEHGIEVVSIISLSDILEYVKGSEELQEYSESIQAYQKQYGCRKQQ